MKYLVAKDPAPANEIGAAKTKAGTPNRSVVASQPAGFIAGAEYTLVSVADVKT
jgi:hypothetical protein